MATQPFSLRTLATHMTAVMIAAPISASRSVSEGLGRCGRQSYLHGFIRGMMPCATFLAKFMICYSFVETLTLASKLTQKRLFVYFKDTARIRS